MRIIDSSEELKKIQLDILDSFHNFCEENHIKYSLAAGTLIGAVRHKGFIPWDDDIDVYLLRDDYNKLVSVFPDIYQNYYSLVTLEREDKWNRAYGKLYDNRTIEVEEVLYNQNIGVGIDIFPIDDAPDDLKQWLIYNKKRCFLRDVMTIKSMKISKDRSLSKNLFVLLCRILLFPIPLRFMAKRMDRLSKVHNGKNYSHVYENCYGTYNTKQPWLKEDFDRVIDAEFEGKLFRIMQGYHDYLTCVYGNYMKLPPVEKRVTHHNFEAWWKED